MACQRTKAAISLKRVKIEEKLLQEFTFTNALLNGAIPDSLRPPLPQDWGFATPDRGIATPTQNSNLKSRENECTDINSLYGRHRIF